jgi:site-specific recombinase XerD
MEILFVLRKSKRNKLKPATLYCRITIDGKRAPGDFSTFIRIKEEHWQSKAQKIILPDGATDAEGLSADHDNDTLINIRNTIKEIYNEFIRKGKPVTANLIKLEYLSRGKPSHTFIQIFEEVIKRKSARKMAKGTIQHNESKYRNTVRFLSSVNRLDLLPEEFTIKLADNFEQWLRTELEKCSHNHAMKHLQLVKQVLKHAARQQYIMVSPLQYLEISFEKPGLPVFLTTEELFTLENHQFASAALQRVADIYVFSCYTGFAYVDYMTFHPDQHVQKDINMDWIYKDRVKSGETAILPFFEKARKLLEKYNGSLPKMTNQPYNRMIKEIAAILGIKKNLTAHTARKTAATMWLNAGVPEETVSRMLGQNSTKELKRYARVQTKKIAEDTKALK